jgi:hypothetical protein
LGQGKIRQKEMARHGPKGSLNSRRPDEFVAAEFVYKSLVINGRFSILGGHTFIFPDVCPSL